MVYEKRNTKYARSEIQTCGCQRRNFYGHQGRGVDQTRSHHTQLRLRIESEQSPLHGVVNLSIHPK